MKNRFFVFIAFLVIVTGCGRLPEYGRPQFLSYSFDIPDQEVIGYKKLARGDFKAMALPVGLKPYRDKLNAYSALAIRPTKDCRYRISSFNVDGQLVYKGQIEHVQFEAVMIPQSSWWKSSFAPRKQSYVLQHEQVHFALMELAARNITNMINREADFFSAFSATPIGAKGELMENIAIFLVDQTKKTVKEHELFDRDTSLYFNPRLQEWWYEKTILTMNRLPLS